MYSYSNRRAYNKTHTAGYYPHPAEEGNGNSARQDAPPNPPSPPRHKEGYFPVPPVDKFQDLRSEIMLKLLEAGVCCWPLAQKPRNPPPRPSAHSRSTATPSNPPPSATSANTRRYAIPMSSRRPRPCL